MRARPGLLTILLLVMGGRASAAEALVPWSQLELRPARAEAPPIGPDRVAAGPAGQVALWNPASGWLDLYESVGAFADGEPSASLRLRAVDEVLWTDAGVVVLDAGARAVALYDAGGQRVDAARLPDLTPPDCGLSARGAALYATDAFGNRHGLATLSRAGFKPWTGPRVSPPEVEVRWRAADGVMVVDGVELALPPALKSGGRALTGGGHTWLIVDQVVSDAPLAVSRVAISLGSGARVALPSGGRLYAPSSDLSVNGRGQLVWLSPTADGLRLGEVSP